MNTFFSNIVSNLKIEGYSNCDPLANNIRDPVLKCIVKYRNHPSILAIGEVYNKNRRLPFSFSKLQRDEILSDILKLETSKACQATGIHTKIVKENADIFTNILVSNFNDSIEKSNFPSILKNATITPVFKKGDRDSKVYQLAYSRIYLKSLRDVFFANYPILWISFCQNTNMVFAKVTARNNVY